MREQDRGGDRPHSAHETDSGWERDSNLLAAVSYPDGLYIAPAYEQNGARSNAWPSAWLARILAGLAGKEVQG